MISPNNHRRPDRDGRERAKRRRAKREMRLVTRCLSGCEAAWEEFYRARTPELVRYVRHFLSADRYDAETVEEIVARVWHTLLRDDASILRRYDPERYTGLGRYLAGVSRFVVRRYLRAERLRRSHESVGGRRADIDFTPSGLEFGTMLNEFAETLNPREVDFLEEYLLSAPNGDDDLSPAAVWQRRHRLLRKLVHFLRDES